ncbi:unnamed protein product, partial [Urochloa humidicola]
PERRAARRRGHERRWRGDGGISSSAAPPRPVWRRGGGKSSPARGGGDQSSCAESATRPCADSAMGRGMETAAWRRTEPASSSIFIDEADPPGLIQVEASAFGITTGRSRRSPHRRQAVSAEASAPPSFCAGPIFRDVLFYPRQEQCIIILHFCWLSIHPVYIQGLQFYPRQEFYIRLLCSHRRLHYARIFHGPCFIELTTMQSEHKLMLMYEWR